MTAKWPAVKTYPLVSTCRYAKLGACFYDPRYGGRTGKEHRYWSFVENRRVRGGRTVQKTVLYLGELNDSQQADAAAAVEGIVETVEAA